LKCFRNTTAMTIGRIMRPPFVIREQLSTLGLHEHYLEHSLDDWIEGMTMRPITAGKKSG
jgi:hypothetical protein